MNKISKHIGFARLAAIPAIFLLTVVAWAANVNTDFDHHVDFSKFHTYSWKAVKTSNQLFEPRVKDAVDKELKAKGWHEVQSGGDVTLTAVGSVANQTEYETFYNGMGGWRWRGFGDRETIAPVNYKVGTLIVDMYNTADKRLIWRGTSDDTLSDKPEKNTKKLDDAVRKMFDKFPPKQK